MGPSLRPSLVLDDHGFRELVAAVVAGHRTYGPLVRDATVTLGEIDSPDDLAAGVTLDQTPGSCRVASLPPGDDRRFAWAVGPESAKRIQHPPERTVLTAQLTTDGLRLDTPAADTGAAGTHGDRPADGSADRTVLPLAVVGLRPCDIAAAGVLDRVLGTRHTGGVRPLVVVVNCAEPGGTCFCASMGTGPALAGELATETDLVLWERPSARRPDYLVAPTSPRGEGLLAGIDTRPAGDADLVWAASSEADAAARMGRRLETDRLAERLMATLDSERWDDVAARCLSCANCTMVCPTCFCTSVDDESSLDGATVTRTQRWDSCFALEHSFVHGGSVRSTTSDRYRQWLTHKLATWWGQFGESGCVGCGRCISWCPVGIDLVEEANALVAEATAVAGPGPPSPTPASGAVSTTEVLVRRRATASDRRGAR